MRIDILTLFPEMCESVLNESIVGRARKNGLVDVKCHDFRVFSGNKHGHVDDYPYGGGNGMLLQPGPIYDCFESVCRDAGTRPHLIYMSAQGKVFDEKCAVRLSEYKNLAILCGHYEGVDQRIIDEIVDEEISIGDYVLTGGELPALTVADAVIRLLPGVLSCEECFQNESHYSGLLEYPQYTRPPIFHGREVPEVLLNGHHAKIEEWRRHLSLKNTLEKRPDLLEKAEITARDREYLNSLKRQNLSQSGEQGDKSGKIPKEPTNNVE